MLPVEICNVVAVAVPSPTSFFPSSVLSEAGVEAGEYTEAVGVIVTVVKNP